MGMFDSFYDHADEEWQTKAFDCNLDRYSIGDTIPADGPSTFQVEILGGEPSRFSLATVEDGVLVTIDAERNPALPFLNYSGHVTRYRPPRRES